MECSDCESNPCICENDEVRRNILTSVLDLMHDKVMLYKDIMQNRVYMIKEDIVSTIAEETAKFQQVINSSILKLDSLVTELQENKGDVILNPEIYEAMNFQLDFNLNSESINVGFSLALAGNYVFFRELLKKKTDVTNFSYDSDEEKT
jgi:hypothetical protein